MANLFSNNVEENFQNLLVWRNRYDKAEYPKKIVINIFYDLIPLNNLWGRLNPYFGQKLYDSFEDAFNKVADEFRINQLSLRPNLLSTIDAGVSVGSLSSMNYYNLVLEAKNMSNKAVEELEYSYIARVAIKAAFIEWFSFGIFGFSKADAYNKVFSVQFPIENYEDFDIVFNNFAEACVSEISGLSRPDGTVLTPSLYQPLPNLWGM